MTQAAFHPTLHRAMQHRVPSKVQAAELARRWREDRDEGARRELVLANLRFVVWVARKYTAFGVSLDDLFGWGCLGLMRAVDSFDPAEGVAFPTYAVWWIQNQVRLGLRTERMVRLPQNKHRDRSRSGELVPIYDETQSLDLSSAAKTPSPCPSPSAGVEGRERLEALNTALATLEPKEALVLRLRFGLEGDGPLTLTEIGDRVGVSRERIRQIEATALARLRFKPVLQPFRGVA